MSTNVSCPHCDGELEFEISSDWQGDGAWGMSVDFVELVEKKCDCEISEEEMKQLEDTAFENHNDHDPANDFEPDWTMDDLGGNR